MMNRMFGRSIVQSSSAAAPSGYPTAAGNTENVCGPGSSASRRTGLVHGAYGAPSTLHSKLASASVAAKPIVADVAIVPICGAVVKKAIGGAGGASAPLVPSTPLLPLVPSTPLLPL